MRYYKLKKDDIVQALLNGKSIFLGTRYNNKHIIVFTLGNEILHGNSVRAALTELNGEKISNSFLIPDYTRRKKIYYSHKEKSLLINQVNY